MGGACYRVEYMKKKYENQTNKQKKKQPLFPSFSTCIISFTLISSETTQTVKIVQAIHKQEFPYFKNHHKMFCKPKAAKSTDHYAYP